MPDTPNLALTYPSGLPGIPPDPANDIKNLALDVDSNVYSRYEPAKTGTADTGWSLTPATLASGWGTKSDPMGTTSGTVTGGVRKFGPRCEVRIRATRTGGTITPSATGNYPDTTILTLSSGYRPASTVYGNFVLPGVTGGMCRVQTDGTVVLTNAFNAASNITSGDVVQIQVDFLV